jgi:hypothetical protein
VVISPEAASVDNSLLLDYLDSEVALNEYVIGSTNPNIPMENNCSEEELHCGMPGGSRDYNGEGDERDENNSICTASRRRWPVTELKMFDVRISDVNGYEGEDVDDADEDADEKEEASQADDGSTQNVKNRGHRM